MDLNIDFKGHIGQVLLANLEDMFSKTALRNQPQICVANSLQIT